jgi:hypothetical protein
VGRIVVALLLIAGFALIALFHTPLYHRFYLFPKQAKAWETIRAHRVPVAIEDGWNEYRGVMHAHSELSHDSKVPFPEIAAALKKADVSFIFMTDHPDKGKGDYSKGWKGLHEGILFVRGYEMVAGFMPWGLPDDTILDTKEEPALLAKRIQALGGVLFIAHCEEPRPWDIPEITGMEIYNLHADLKDENINELAPEIVLSLWSYPDQTLRLIFDRPTGYLTIWDDLNRTRKITGIAANDAHQNTGVRGVYTAKDTLRLLDTGHIDEAITEIRLNFLTHFLLRVLFGPLAPDKQLFRVDLDPYERSARYVNTHLLAKECTEPALLDALRQGRGFVGFDMIADARGFKYIAEGAAPEARKVVMGESISFEPDLKLRIASPYTCRFTILRYGVQVAQLTGNTFDWNVSEPGKYRVEAELDILGEWTPWVYTNPIEVTARTK